MLLKHKFFIGYKNDSTFKVFERSITAEHVNIVELLFHYQPQCDSFEPGIVTTADPSPIYKLYSTSYHLCVNQQISLHSSNVLFRFCLANQLEEAFLEFFKEK